MSTCSASIARTRSDVYGAGELFKLWHKVGVRPTGSWNKVRGPISACHLSLDYIGWTMPEPFKFVTDRNDVITLTMNSPALVGKLMQEAI